MNILGSVAKGVSGAVFGSDAQGSSPEDLEVEALLGRVSDGVLSEDRREALHSLRDSLLDNPKAQAAVGAMGFPVLAEVLREDRDDVEMVRAALEVLVGACTPVSSSDTEQQQEVPVSSLNADLFAREPANAQLLLSLLDDEPVGIDDFYVRYHTVQLLTSLLSSSSYRLQDAIMSSPMGVVRLMDMMMESEVIRNESLLLLIALTRANEEIQKIVAFEGAFERLFNIIREEGALDGGIVVQDCLELLNNLLGGNSANQLMFREMGFVQQLTGMMKGSAPPETFDVGLAFGQAVLPRQKAANILCALETVMLLIVAHAAGGSNAAKPQAPEAMQLQEQNLVANKELLVANGVLEILLELSLAEGGVRSSSVRVQAMRCMATLVEHDDRNRDRFGSSLVRIADQDIPTLQALLRVALSADGAVERAAAQEVIRCYCVGNPDGQTMLASTLSPVSGSVDGGKGPSSFGSELAKALVGGEDLLRSCRAAATLSYLLDGNPECKQRILSIPLLLPESSASPPELLMPRVVSYLASSLEGGGQGRLAAATLLRLLITWLDRCPPAVAAFLAPASHIPTLMEIAQGRLGAGDALVSGMACVLAAVCLVNAPPPGEQHPRGCGAPEVLDILTNRLGLREFFLRWEELRRHPAFVAASSRGRVTKHFTRETAAAATSESATLESLAEVLGSEESPLDRQFAAFVEGFQEEAQKFVLKCYSCPQEGFPGSAAESLVSWQGTDAEQLAAAKEALTKYAAELKDLRARNASLAESLLRKPGGAPGAPAGTDEPREPGEEGAAAPVAAPGSAEAMAAAEMRASKAEAEAQGLGEQLARAKSSIRQLEADLNRERDEHEQQKAESARLEAELSDLSSAYNTLEAHSYSLESQMKELQQRLQDALRERPGGGASEEQIRARVEEAVAAAKADAEESMGDLLECLGQEEAKAERMRERLEELGEDVDALLDGIGEEGGEADTSGGS